MMMTMAAAAAEQSQGWGRLVGLLVAGAVFWAGVSAYERWRKTQDDPSPTAIEGGAATVKPQVSGDSDSDSDSGDSGRGVVVRRSADIDAYLSTKAGSKSTTALVREAARRFGKAEATVWRAYRRVTKGGAK